MLALIALVCIVSVALIGTQASTFFNTVANTL
jgi:Flp pilus assembly pilin Flp